ncbi:MAG: hypothetical protein A6F70_05945 [Cycloclasticus sp. symbiont of Bathymodiolus heckerae]|nr:MAG: hypothetical protein A6F70_05945 [Cycloclasticus sp. symbiont of Bathymodiolus heckerae]
MKRRLYFLLPDHDTTEQVVNEMLIARITESNIHVLAKSGANMKALPEANLLQSSDFIHSVETGAAVGGVTGVLAGLAAMTFPPTGLVLGGGAVLGMALAGSGVGSWGSAMIGISTPNSRLKSFQKAVDDGRYLMMVDVPVKKVGEITKSVKRHHPDATIHACDSDIPAHPLGGVY